VSPSRDPFKPNPGETFSKGEVNRSGRLVRAVITSDLNDNELWSHYDLVDVVRAYRAVTWWRSLHARPLTKVAVNLRWTIHRTRDYIASPKPSGYRALHHIVQRDGYKIEVQLRTTLQDAWANQVEDDGRHTHLGFKFGRGPVYVHDYYVAMSDAFALMDLDQPLPDQLVSDLKQRYARIRGVLPR
jgi:hypothetical protein